MTIHIDRKTRDNLAIGALSTALGVSMAAIGGVYAWGVYIALLGSGLGLLFFSIHRIRRGGTIKIQWPFWLALVLALVSLIQAIPLSSGVLKSVYPVIYHRLSVLYGLAGIPLRSHSIALNPHGALFSVNKFIAAGFVFLLAMNLAHKPRRGHRVIRVMIGLGIILLLIALFDLIVTPGKVMGVYTPLPWNRPWMYSLLVNPNTLSAVLNLTGFMAMGMYMDSRRKSGYLVAALLLLSGAILTLSRAGIAGTVAGIAMFLFVGSVGLRRHLSAWVVVPLLIAAFFVFMVVFDRSVSEIGTRVGLVHSAHTRLEMALTGLDAFYKSPFLGIGQMGFGDFFRAFGRFGRDTTSFFVENEFAQYLADFGIFGLAAVVIFLVWFVHVVVIARKDGPTTGLSIGLSILLLQGLADFNAEMPGVLFLVAASLGVLYGMGTYGSSRREARFFRSLRSGPVLISGLVITGIAVGTLIFWKGPRKMMDANPDIDKSTGVQAFVMGALGHKVFGMMEPVVSLDTTYAVGATRRLQAVSLVYRRLDKVIGYWSLNPRPYAGAAAAMMAAGAPDYAIKLARAACVAAPHSTWHKLFLVDVLTSAGRYKAAAGQARTMLDSRTSELQLMARLTRIPGGIRTAALIGDNYYFTKDMLDFMRYRVKGGGRRFCGMVLSRYPKNCACRAVEIQQYLAEHGDLAKADLAATVLLGECPDLPDGYLALGRVMQREGKRVEAYYMLMEARKRLGQRLSLGDLLAMVSLQIDLGYLKEADKNLTLARREGRGMQWVQLRVRVLQSRILIKEGRMSDALLQLDDAMRIAPSNVGVLRDVLHVYLEIGALRKALDVLKRMYNVTHNERYKKQEAAIRRRLQLRLLQ